MNLEKLFGSKAKVDILKYLLFKRQWLSLRALESELQWTFPAIKKQVDSLSTAGVLVVNKEKMKRSIDIFEEFHPHIKNIFLYALKAEVEKLFEQHEFSIDQYFFGKVFGKNLDMDLVLIHSNAEKPILEQIKSEISDLFTKYFIYNLSVTFMSTSEWEKRYRLADKFVLKILGTIGK